MNIPGQYFLIKQEQGYITKKMKKKLQQSILTLMTLSLLFSSASADSNCFIASKNGKWIAHNGECNKRYPPYSTFKIAISLMV